MSQKTSQIKTCTQCKKLLPVTEFNFRNRSKDIRHSYCRECGKNFTRQHYKKNKRQYLDRNARYYARRKEFVRKMKSYPCTDCGVQYPYYVMDFDHREGEIKENMLSRIEGMTINSIRREIAKCDAVCANCHRERTHQRRMKRKSVVQLDEQ